MPGAGT
jgi:hypothetical protein